jgi:hypothetical protein
MRGYVSIDVDVDDVLDELSDGDLLEALMARKGQKLAKDDPASELAVIQSAYDALLRGDSDYCALLLERVLRPKWASPDDATKAYVAAMGARQ